ncbi:MAG: ROK family protein [Lachnospiraceae bacterium]|nr:ROK family protein [Lachnospiraceae bacterium]
MKYYIGIDLGGTNIAAGLVSETGEILGKGSIPTRSGRPAGEIVKDMAELAVKTAADYGLKMEQVEAVGIGVPGTANQERGIVEYANNLGFFDEPVLEMMRDCLPGTKVYFDNDANAAAWAEFLVGSGKGSTSLVAVTLGTGVGGGIVLDGKLYQGINFGAAELGHMVIVQGGEPCTCGRRGCFEAYASATALIRQTREAMEAHRESVLWELCGQDLEQVEGKTLFDAVRREDETAKQVLDQYIQYLGTGIVNIVNIFQPEVICIGGGISKAGELLLGPLNQMLDEGDYARYSEKRTRLVIASLENDAGIIGAALLGR